MSKLREKIEGVTKQTTGQMIGGDVLVQQGRHQQREPSGQRIRTMPSKDH